MQNYMRKNAMNYGYRSIRYHNLYTFFLWPLICVLLWMFLFRFFNARFCLHFPQDQCQLEWYYWYRHGIIFFLKFCIASIISHILVVTANRSHTTAMTEKLKSTTAVCMLHCYSNFFCSFSVFRVFHRSSWPLAWLLWAE